MNKFNKLTILLLFSILLSITISSQASIHLPPLKVNGPSDLAYEEGSTGNVLEWVFEADESNDNPTIYFVRVDDAVLDDHDGESWEDNVAIEVNIDGLVVGEHTVEIEVQDNGFPDQTSATKDSVQITVVAAGEQLPEISDTEESQFSNGFLILIIFTLIAIPKINRR